MKRYVFALLLVLVTLFGAPSHAQTYSLGGKTEAQFAISACGSVSDVGLYIYDAANGYALLDFVGGSYIAGHAIFDVSADAQAYGDAQVAFYAYVDSDCSYNESTVAILD